MGIGQNQPSSAIGVSPPSGVPTATTGAVGRESRASAHSASTVGRGGAVAVQKKRYGSKIINWLRVVAFGGALIPAIALVVGFFTDDLTANPIEYITRQTGYWALTLLVITLAVTPARRLTGWNEIIRLRRMFGLFAFFYGTLHLLTWIVLDKFFDFPWMLEDIADRRFITIGMLTWLLLLPLAITSTKKMVKRLGKRWQTLHRLSYVAAVTGVIHYWWLVKADLFYPQMLSAALAVLFAIRIWWTWRTRTLSRF